MGMANLYPPYLDSAELDVPMTREMLQEKARRLTTLLVNGLKNYKV
jgi:hypothetical protein